MTRKRRAWGRIKFRGKRVYAGFVHPVTGAETMRRVYGVTSESSQRALDAAMDDLEALVKAPPARVGVRFADWLRDEHLAVMASGMEQSSLRSAGVHVQRLADWLTAHGDPTMELVDRRMVEQFVADLLAEPRKPSYVARLTRTLRSIWRDAIARGIAAENPWVALRIRRQKYRDVPYIDPTQLCALYAATNESQRPLIVLLGETGLRLGEALALRWGDVDESVHVREGKTDAARRSVPLTPDAAAALTQLTRGGPGDLVFLPRAQYGVVTAVHRACKRAGLPRLWPHALRHEFTCHHLQAGTPVPTVARLLGHSDGGALLLRRYGRWIPQDAESKAQSRMHRWRLRQRRSTR